MTVSCATDVAELGNTAQASGLAASFALVGYSRQRSYASPTTPGIDQASLRTIQPGAGGNGLPIMLGRCFPSPRIHHGSSCGVQR